MGAINPPNVLISKSAHLLFAETPLVVNSKPAHMPFSLTA
jgi:hypothetical protein